MTHASGASGSSVPVVAAFELEADITHAVDFRIARHGGVVLYRRAPVLDEAVRALIDLGYDVVRLDAVTWWSTDAMYDEFARGLHFPDYFGRNPDALNDCLYDVAHGDYGWRVEGAGLALVISGFGAFTQRFPEEALILVDSLAGTSRTALLYGHRIASLLHVDDPAFRIGPVGGGMIPWNDAEWSESHRR